MKRILCSIALGGFFIASVPADFAAARQSTAPAPAPAPVVDLDQLETALTQGRLIQAKAMIEAAILARQKSPRLDLLTADYDLASKQNDLALSAYQTLLPDPALKARAAEGAGIAAFRLGHDKEAYRFLEISVATEASRWRAWNTLGVLADKKLDWPAAEKAYRAAETANPHNAAILNNLGYSYLLQHRFSKAIDAFRSALALGPDNAIIKTNIDFALALNGQYAEAIGNEDNGPQLSRRLNNAGVAAHLRHDDAAAIAFLSRAIEVSDVYNVTAADNLDLIRNAKKETP